MSISKDPLKKLTHVRMSKGGSRSKGQNKQSEKIKEEKPENTPEEIKEEKKIEKAVSTPAGPVTAAKKNVETEEKSVEKDSSESSDQLELHKPKKNRLPGFLSKISAPKTNEVLQGEPAQRALAIIEEHTKENPNSFGSIFTREHQEISGIQRVFKKSIAFLVINMALFGMLTLSSINLFAVPIWFTVTSVALYIASSCLFFIIVADRSYLWLSIAGQAILLLLIHSFLGQGFTVVTILLAFFIAILIFSAYSELEKIQLGSRLFFISHITSESIRILTTAVAVILSLGLFNSMVSAGTESYIEDNFYTNESIVDYVLIGYSSNLTPSRLLVKGHQNFTPNEDGYTFRDFLTFNYDEGTVLSQNEANDIIISCQSRPDTTTTSCNEELNEEEDRRLKEFRQRAYPGISFQLDDVIEGADYETLVKEHYLYLVRDLQQEDYESDFIVIPSKFVIPAFFSIALFAFLLIIQPILGWIAYLLTWLTWKILRWIGFARIEVEAVEAEIVSI